MTSYTFFKTTTGRHIGFDLSNVRPPQNAIVGVTLVLKFGLDPVYSFGNIAIFIFAVLA